MELQDVISSSPLVLRLLGVSRVRLPEVFAIYDTGKKYFALKIDT